MAKMKNDYSKDKKKAERMRKEGKKLSCKSIWKSNCKLIRNIFFLTLESQSFVSLFSKSRKILEYI